jgi:putative Mg2+ transporter-C (MgtC) family protein
LVDAQTGFTARRQIAAMLTIEMSDGTLLVRILVAAALGGIVGIERELKDQPAGFRTHILLSVGSALFTIVGAFGFQAFTGGSETQRVQADLTRVASQIVAGIGFLGGGTILKYGATVRGLTTAASLWVTAAIGMAVGMGFYFASTATAAVAVLALAGLKPFERKFLRRGNGASPPSMPPD